MGIEALTSESVEDFEVFSLFSAIAGLGVIAIVAFSLIINVAFSTVGGVIGAVIVHRKAPAE